MKRLSIKDITSTILVSICKNLPGNKTILEKEGFCQSDSPNCKYYKEETSFCKKKTYTPTRDIIDHLTSQKFFLPHPYSSQVPDTSHKPYSHP